MIVVAEYSAVVNSNAVDEEGCWFVSSVVVPALDYVFQSQGYARDAIGVHCWMIYYLDVSLLRCYYNDNNGAECFMSEHMATSLTSRSGSGFFARNSKTTVHKRNRLKKCRHSCEEGISVVYFLFFKQRNNT